MAVFLSVESVSQPGLGMMSGSVGTLTAIAIANGLLVLCCAVCCSLSTVALLLGIIS